ncbi:MAG: hypothetical protein PHQ98_04210 [Candidatus ainarchaeum sp.]|nr:hypothetical protein [Candidatus ainarchaeum sp.]
MINQQTNPRLPTLKQIDLLVFPFWSEYEFTHKHGMEKLIKWKNEIIKAGKRKDTFFVIYLDGKMIKKNEMSRLQKEFFDILEKNLPKQYSFLAQAELNSETDKRKNAGRIANQIAKAFSFSGTVLFRAYGVHARQCVSEYGGEMQRQISFFLKKKFGIETVIKELNAHSIKHPTDYLIELIRVKQNRKNAKPRNIKTLLEAIRKGQRK